MMVIGYGRMHHSSVRCTGIIEKLLDLVAANVAQNAAVFFVLEKPCGPVLRRQAVRPETKHLEHAADLATLDEVTRKDRGFHVQSLAVVNRKFSPGAGYRRARFGKLFEGRKRRLVREIILSRVQHPAAQRSPVGGHCRRGHHAHLPILQDLAQAAGDLRFRTPLLKSRHLRGVRIVNPLNDTPRLRESVSLTVNVSVVEMRRRKDKFPRLHDRLRLALWRVNHPVNFLCTHVKKFKAGTPSTGENAC